MEGIERADPLETIAVEPLLPDADLTLVSDDEYSSSLESESESSYGYGRSPRRARASVVEKVDAKALKPNIAVSIPASNLIHPRSICVHGFEPPAPPASESEALKSLLPLLHNEEGDYLELELDDFSVYTEKPTYLHEMRPLHHLLAGAWKTETFLVDGVVSHGDSRFFVRRIDFGTLQLSGYLSGQASIGNDIWIQSKLQERMFEKPVYYRLKNPTLEYRRFYTPFLWVADLTKHVIDFLFDMQAKRRISIQDFKSKFNRWLLKTYGGSPAFQQWYGKFTSTRKDFRSSVATNIEFIWKEAFSLDGGGFKANHHNLWAEIKFDAYKVSQGIRGYCDESSDELEVSSNAKKIGNTIVTPYIFSLFSHLPLGKVLQEVDLSEDTHKRRKAVISRGAAKPFGRSLKVVAKTRQDMIAAIAPGTVISTLPDPNSVWDPEKARGHRGDFRWFGVVQSVGEVRSKRHFYIIWLYKPHETPCGEMKYYWNNELFLSDHCSDLDEKKEIDEEDVLETHTVQWGGQPGADADAEFFARQTYSFKNRSWTTLNGGHFRCEHHRGQEKGETTQETYQVGNTVLVDISDAPEGASRYTEPCEIIELIPETEQSSAKARLRRLLRRRETVPTAAPNDLVYSSVEILVHLSAIRGYCIVRCFPPGSELPAPYDRNGTGNLFVVTHRQEMVEDTESSTGTRVVMVPITNDNMPASLRQGFDPAVRGRQLRGLDLFCGGGNFGRGLEEAGAVKMMWVNDISKEAIHTYMANVDKTSSKTTKQSDEVVRPFLGSIDDLLGRAITGQWSASVPSPGQVEFISGGSPCQGFSSLTLDKTTPQQIKNQSLVASFASSVDLYRPLFGLLENVPGIIKKKRVEDVFSQLIGALVGLGYQTQVLLLDAWSYGCPQTRSRVLLSFAAPGVSLPSHPRPSHSTPDKAAHRLSRGLGLMANSEYLCERPAVVLEPISEVGEELVWSDESKNVHTGRRNAVVPFHFVSAAQATADLPPILDGKPDCCVAFPDHRLAVGMTRALTRQVRLIPTYPFTQNFVKAWYGSRHAAGRAAIAPSDRHLFPDEGKHRVSRDSCGWGRVDPNGLFQTISTTSSPTDARMGSSSLHWQEARPQTIMEARRAQGFRDEDVLLGHARQRWKTVGNSVPGQLAVVLGLALRQAWMGSLLEGEGSLEGTLEWGVVDEQVAEDASESEVRTVRGGRKVPKLGKAGKRTLQDDSDGSSPGPLSAVNKRRRVKARKSRHGLQYIRSSATTATMSEKAALQAKRYADQETADLDREEDENEVRTKRQTRSTRT